ncbi:unnamed protein product [Brassicogethes aeneus]|uniref:Translation initiation factor 3 N-terminal domain-containing protein n=1 Tax=Brassicogethes aeneus TaxID=1431903 RepID=A0A9P0FM63_BRAAE|nr:unnamed protein product [Brassicogethes aeneus]
MILQKFTNSLKLINYATNVLNTTSKNKLVCNCTRLRYFSTNPTNKNYDQQNPKRKTAIIPKITLISGQEINITTVEEAQKLSKRRDLKLVKIVDMDTKTHRPVYKLMTGAEYHAEDLKQREEKKKDRMNASIKGEKVMIMNQNIAQHDVEVNVKKIQKWLKKLYEVRIVINGDSSNMEKAENIYTLLEEGLKNESRFLQKRIKGNDIKCQILPPKQSKLDNNDNDSQKSL